MEYEFRRNTLTGTVLANFSMDHEALGFWFEDPSLNTNDNQWNCDKPMTSKEQDEVQRQVFLIVERALKPCGRTLG